MTLIKTTKIDKLEINTLSKKEILSPINNEQFEDNNPENKEEPTQDPKPQQ